MIVSWTIHIDAVHSRIRGRGVAYNQSQSRRNRGAQMFRKSLWLIAIVLACKGPPPKIPAGPPSIEGRVTGVQKSGDRIGRINVDAPSTSAAGVAKAAVRVTESTAVIGPPPRPKTTDFNALHEGLWVRVWFVGPVGQSYPVQAHAGTIVIDSTATPPQ
jgi:hypothetical protein